MKIVSVTHLTPTNITITVLSSNGRDEYDIGVLFFINEDRWEAINCNCRGFTNHMKCKHVSGISEYISNLPKPAGPGPVLLMVGRWYQCEICNNNTFLFRPPLNRRGVTQAICAKCGRSYEVI